MKPLTFLANFVCTFSSYLHTTFQVPNFSSSLLFAIKPKVKYRFRDAAMVSLQILRNIMLGT